MHKKFEINRTKIKGGCQSGRVVVTRNSKSDLPLAGHLITETVSVWQDQLILPTFRLTKDVNKILSATLCIST